MKANLEIHVVGPTYSFKSLCGVQSIRCVVGTNKIYYAESFQSWELFWSNFVSIEVIACNYAIMLRE